MVLVVLTFVLFLSMRGWIHRVHGRWFGLSGPQIDQVCYAFMGFYKLAIWFFLLMPLVVLLVIR